MPVDTHTRYLFDSRIESPLGSVGGAAVYQDSRWDFEGPRTIRYYSLTYILDGHCHYSEPNGRSFDFSAGDLFFCFPGMPHRLDPTEGDTFSEFWIAFRGTIFDTWREAKLLDPAKLSLHLEPVEYWLGRFENLFVNVRQDMFGQMMLLSALQSLLAEAMSVQPKEVLSPDEAWIGQAKELIEGVFRADELDLESIAAQMGVSYSTFRRRFTQLAGTAPRQYHTAVLMRRICEWLHTSSAASREAAEWFGFTDESHFYRRFKEVVGVSPRQYREQLRRDDGPAKLAYKKRPET